MALAVAVLVGAGVGTGTGLVLRGQGSTSALEPLQPAGIPTTTGGVPAEPHLDPAATTGDPAGRTASPTTGRTPAATPSTGSAHPSKTAAGAGASASAAGPVTIAAAGDIACPASSPDYAGGAGTAGACRQRATSDLVAGHGYDAVLVLGDLQYDNGSAASFQQVYGPTWGRVRSVTRPVIGNHEYGSGGDAYFDYFGAAAGPRGQGWYSFDLGGWHVVALNSNCDRVGCARGSAQERWLAADLAAHPSRCTLAMWHHPRWSGGEHGDNPVVSALVEDLYAAGADVILNGHDHDYERFAPQDPSGGLDRARGVREFVVGTGGKSHYRVTPSARTEASSDDTYGVLELTLRAGGYDWRFRPEAGRTFSDRGSADCH
jgi:hypothetical protein